MVPDSSFSSSSSEPVRKQKPSEIKTQREEPAPPQQGSWLPSLPCFSRTLQGLFPSNEDPRNRGHRQPDLAQGHPLAARARSPTAPSAPWCLGLASPCPQGVACGAPAQGQRKAGGQRMRRLSPGEGREAGPYLIAEDAVRLVTPSRHGGAQLGLARRLQAER